MKFRTQSYFNSKALLLLVGSLFLQSAFAGLTEADFQRLAQLPGANREDSVTETDLRNLLEASVQLMLTHPTEKAAEYRAIRASVQNLKTAYIDHHQAAHLNIENDADGDPVIFQSLRIEAERLSKILKSQAREDYIRGIFPNLPIGRISNAEFGEIYSRVEEEDKLLQKANSRIAELIRAGAPRSGYSQNAIQVRRVVEAVSSQRGEEGALSLLGRLNPFKSAKTTDDSKFGITTDNLLLGYSVFELLHFSGEFRKIRTNQELDANKPLYQGEMTFELAAGDLNDLVLWLDEIGKWKDDFDQIMGALVGEGYAEIGQKPLREWLTAEVPPATRDVMERMRRLALYGSAERTVLLFNTVSLDLTNSPQRDFWKKKIEESYRAEALVSSNSKRKTFIDNTYRTNIGVTQIQRISRHLNRFVMVKKIVNEFFGSGTGDDPYSSGEYSDSDFIKQFKSTELNQVLGILAPPAFQGANFDYLDGKLYNLATLDSVESRSREILHDILTRYSAVNFYPDPNSVREEITERQIQALYQGRPLSNYTGNVSHKNISALMNSLRRSELVQAILLQEPGLSESLGDFERQMIGKLNEYHGYTQGSDGDGLYYSKYLIDQAVDHIEQLVSLLVYSQQSGVTQDSAKKALNQLAGLVGSELIGGCPKGLTGRTTQILSGLVFNTGNLLKDALAQKKQEAYQQASLWVATGNEGSSIAAQVNRVVSPFIGLAGDRGEVANLGNLQRSGYAKTAMEYILSLYNPVTVYEAARSFLGNRFWQLNIEKDDEGMYKFLEDLHFGSNREELDRLYRVNGNREQRWQYAFFEQYLPSRLVQVLVESKILAARPHSTSGMKSEYDSTNSFHIRTFSSNAEMLMTAKTYQPPAMVRAPVVVPQRPPVDTTSVVESVSPPIQTQSALPQTRGKTGD